ncbi:XRE family transcriptional regulator [Nocardia blacklockiae]|uniref:XRE family transcriptional regulator n=1 Tax=Nocardia blacklockiae TaxID=480036 RepID=UPI001895B55D|nr:XRE family transcriptional regulator [Nocardia blacklockiae]MBF6176123.1 XRE family transcriptional regulator [Nocardia blacklockiae]
MSLHSAPNERLRAAIADAGVTVDALAERVGLDPKSVQRWVSRGVVPRRTAAHVAAAELGVAVGFLWPEMDLPTKQAAQMEIVDMYPHRADTPRRLWLDLLAGTQSELWLFANASLFLPEQNPESIELIREKAENGVDVRILLGDPDAPEMALRGEEERLYEAIPARIRMALTYYSPLVEVPGVEFLLHRTCLYNSIFRYDDQMLVNQHVYGTYGYMAPVLHLRRIHGGDFFDMYVRSFERVRETASPITESMFWSKFSEANFKPPAPV